MERKAASEMVSENLKRSLNSMQSIISTPSAPSPIEMCSQCMSPWQSLTKPFSTLSIKKRSLSLRKPSV